MEMIEQKEKEECIICLDEVETIWRKLGCHHLYHKKCIEEWMRVSDRCPLCMKSIRMSEVEEIHSRIIIEIQEMNRNSMSQMEEISRIAIRRYVIFMCCIIAMIIVIVLCRP